MPQLDREEYIEQAYFFRTVRERLTEELPAQEILADVREEILATTKLPMAIDVLRGEIELKGRMSEGMAALPHYFSPFQIYVMSVAELDRARFDQHTALEVLEREARYRGSEPTCAGLFIYQFECLARNRLGYDKGMTAMSADPLYPPEWKDWILKTRRRLGAHEFADMIYYRSEYFVEERRRRTSNPQYRPGAPVLFSQQEGRIAKAHRGKDPLYLFAALQRQLGYPAIPRAQRSDDVKLPPQLEQRLQRIEKRIGLVESEQKGKLDLSEFYLKPPKFPDDDTASSGNL
jgi:hypothetical protein